MKVCQALYKVMGPKLVEVIWEIRGTMELSKLLGGSRWQENYLAAAKKIQVPMIIITKVLFEFFPIIPACILYNIYKIMI